MSSRVSSRRSWTVVGAVTVVMLSASLAVSDPGGSPLPAADRGLTPRAGPVIFADGFDSGDLSAWSDGSGLVVEGPAPVGGSSAARAVLTDGPAWASADLPDAVTDVVLTGRVRVESAGSEPVGLLSARSATGSEVAGISVGAGRALWVRNGVSGVAIAVPAALGRDWHTVSLRVHVAGSEGSVAVDLDGAEVQAWRTDIGDAPVARVQVGDTSERPSGDLLVDDVSATRGTGPRPRPAASTDPVLVAAGDIACDPQSSSFKGGAGTSRACRMQDVADLVLADGSVDVVAALGDVQYYCGGADAFAESYDPTWGRFRDLTRPAVGNHEYLTEREGGEEGEEAEEGEDGATDCDTTGRATGYFDYFGELAGDPDRGYYSYDLGTWHVVVLNTSCSAAGGCGAGSPQQRWLVRDLARNPARCTLAYFHIPLWSSGGRANDNARAMTRDLVAAGADVVLTGHDHIYERFDPQDAEGRADPKGVRAWVVGTGGSNLTDLAAIAPNSAVLDTFTFGVLRLVLREASYDWSFVPTPDGAFNDPGSARCV